MNRREQRQKQYSHLLQLAGLYSKLASTWHKSDNGTDWKYIMCLDADKIADGLRDRAASLYPDPRQPLQQ